MKWFELVKVKDSFIVGTDNLDTLEIHGIPEGSFYFFLNKSNRSLVKRFVLCEKLKVDYICQVVLIKKGSKFTPRLSFSIRDKLNDKILNAEVPENLNTKTLKANVNLNDCHDNF